MSGLAVSAVYMPQPVTTGRGRRLAVAAVLALLVAALVGGRMTSALFASGRNGFLPDPVAHAAVPPDTPAVPAAHPTDVAGRVLRVPGTPGTLEVVDPSFRTEFDGRGVHYLAAHATQPLSLELSSVARGAHAVDLRRDAWHGAGSVAERNVARDVVERVTASSGRIEWDVVLAAPLPGTGDLAITARLDGITGAPLVVVRDGRPALQVAVGGGADVTIGEIVVRDARGVEVYRALPDITTNAVTLRVPARVLDGAHYPLTVDPTVSSPVTVASPATNLAPAMAYNGTKWLVVWEQLVGGVYDVYGSLVNGDATGSASTPFRISFRTQDEVLPRVAWSQNRFLVVWQHNLSSTDVDVRGQLLDANGALVGGELPISIPSSQQRTPAVTAGIGGFLVSWSDNRDGPLDIYSARVAVDGTLLDGNGFRTDRPAGTDSSGYEATVPDVAWNGSKFLVVWQERFGPLSGGGYTYSIVGRVVGADASLGFFNAIALWGDANQQPTDPSIAASGTQFLVAWEQNSDVVAARVVNLNFLFTGEQIQVSTANNVQDDPVVTANGGDYLVAWRDRRDYPTYTDYDLYAARVGTDGTVKDPNGIAVSRYATNEVAPAVAPGASGKWGVTYQSGPNGATSIYTRLVSPK
jgi:hypothetical protein